MNRCVNLVGHCILAITLSVSASSAQASGPSDQDLDKIFRNSIAEMGSQQYMCHPKTIKFQSLQVLKRGRAKDETYPMQVQVDFTCELQHRMGTPVGNRWTGDIFVKRNQYDEWAAKAVDQGKIEMLEPGVAAAPAQTDREAILNTRKDLKQWFNLRQQHKFDFLPALRGEDRKVAEFALAAAKAMVSGDLAQSAQSVICSAKNIGKAARSSELDSVVGDFRELRLSSPSDPKLTDFSRSKPRIAFAAKADVFDLLVEWKIKNQPTGLSVGAFDFQVYRLTESGSQSGSYCLTSSNVPR